MIIEDEREETVMVPCPDCGELGAQPIKRIASLDVVPCTLCAGLIDLSADDCRAVVLRAKALLGLSSVPGGPSG